MTSHTATTSCSNTYCVSREQPKCRKCGDMDPKIQYNNALHAWKLSKQAGFSPMANNAFDTHAYLCPPCFSAENNNRNLFQIHAQDNDFIAQRKRYLAINNITADNRSQFKRVEYPNILQLQHKDNPNKEIFVRIRLVNSKDVSNKGLLDMLDKLQIAVGGMKPMSLHRECLHKTDFGTCCVSGKDGYPEYHTNVALREQDLAAYAIDNPDNDSYMAVAFVDARNTNTFTVPAAALIFTAEGKLAWMHVNMQDNNKPLVIPENGVRVQSSRRSISPPTDPDASLNRVMHIDQVFTLPQFQGFKLSQHLVRFIESICPDDTVYMGLYTSHNNIAMIKTATHNTIGMLPNAVYALPENYHAGGYNVSYMKALSRF